MEAVLQILSVLLLIILIIQAVFKREPENGFALPQHYPDLLNDYVSFYTALNEEGQQRFEDRLRRFLSAVKITGANAVVEDLDRVLIAAAAVIPVFYIPDWEYMNLREVLLYPGHFTTEFEQEGSGRTVSGMVGNAGMDGVMVLSKWGLRQGFIDSGGTRNTAIHEAIHLIDKMDGTLDGVPELLLEKKYVAQWKALLEATMQSIREGTSDIDAYGATGPVECFAVVAEYFFKQRSLFEERHPQLAEMLVRIFVKKG